MLILAIVAAFLLGLAIGVVYVRVTIRNERLIGTLRVDESDPDDGPYLFLELSTNPEIIKQKEYVTLKVNANNYLSQK